MDDRDTQEGATEPREVTFLDRIRVAEIASQLLREGGFDEGDALLDAVRCCGEFPECGHVLDWSGE